MRVCNLTSGSKGNSTYVETNNHKILIDVGTTCLYIENALKSININPSDIDIVLITHAHTDHISGLEVFNKRYHPKVYATLNILNEAKLDSTDYDLIDSLNDISDIKISEIALSHDAKDIKGYIIEENSSSMVYITDTGYINKKYFDILNNRNLYIFESNHNVEMLMNNPNYPYHTKIRILGDKGHLSNEDSSYYLSKIIGKDTKYVVLAHLSEQNNTEEIALNCFNDMIHELNKYHPNVLIAKQNICTDIFEI